jgi:hypothetical protein
MKPGLIVSFCIFLSINSCKNSTGQLQKEKPNSSIGTIKKTKASTQIKKEPKPVFGYRFTIIGDFDGDGKKEKLIEHFYSRIDHKETNKFYENADYDQLVELTEKKKPYSFISCDNKRISDLPIAAKDQLLGLAYLKNEGDLNGDGTDEISYVVDWADWSNLNTMHIMTYKNRKWKELYSFSIWDWQLPDLPQTYNQYGPFGLQDKIINTKNDSVNKIIEQNLDNFKGLIKKVANNKIQIIYDNEESDLDTMIVNLKKVNKNRRANRKLK